MELSTGSACSQAANHALQSFEQQVLRVLRCSAQALAHSPGGLRFRAGTRPWLDVLAPSQAGRDTLGAAT